MPFNWNSRDRSSRRVRKMYVSPTGVPKQNDNERIKRQLHAVQGVNLVKLAAQEALRCSGPGWFPESDVAVGLGNKKPLEIKLAGFKRIEILVNPKSFAARGVELQKRCSQHSAAELMENAAGSLVRLFAGHYTYCPWDAWRHRGLVRAATWAVSRSYLTTKAEEDLAAACVLFFERSVVAYRLTEIEGELFVRGLRHEGFINNQPTNLLSCLFEITQSMIFPKEWRTVLQSFPLEQDPIAEALMPEVMSCLFGGRVRSFRGRMVLRGRATVPSSLDWGKRVERLAELLVPYLRSQNDAPGAQPNPFGQQGGNGNSSGNGTGPAGGTDEFSPETAPNPFAQSNEASSDLGSPDLDTSSGQSAGRGRPGAPPVYNDFEAIDRYYSARAKEIDLHDESDEVPERKPENIVVGYLGHEEASWYDLVSGRIDWFRTRPCPTSETHPNGLKLFRRTEPLEVPAKADHPNSEEVPHLLLVVDSSGSMKFNMAAEGAARGKYDLVLLAAWGMLSYLQKPEHVDRIQACAINFSNSTSYSGWKSGSSLIEVKKKLAVYQGGGTTLDVAQLRKALNEGPGEFLTVIVTDGGLKNYQDAAVGFEEVVNKGHSVVLLHIGNANAFTEGIRKIGGQVHLLQSADDLTGLCLDLAKKTYAAARQR